jgi:vancomycin resistance protein YoaR
VGLDRLGRLLRDPRAKVTVVVVIFVGGVLAAMAAGQSDVVLKGVIVGGIPVSGLSAEELVERLRPPANAIEGRQITLVAGDRSWATTPAAAGIAVDLPATVERALKAGRENPVRWIGRTLVGGRMELAWVPAVDEKALARRVSRLAADVRTEAANGAVRFQGPNVVVTPPTEGVSLLEEKAADVLVAAAMRPSDEDRLALPVKVIKPTIDIHEVEVVQEQAQAILSAPVDFRFRDQAATLPPDRVASALQVEIEPAEAGRKDENLSLGIDPEELRRQLVAVAPTLEIPARDATFTVEKDRVTLVGSQEGWTADTASAVEQLLALSRGGQRAPIVLNERPLAPTLTTDAARQLGIAQRISTYRTTFDPTNAPRVGNIGRMAVAIDGKVVKPGETFSLNDATGPRTPANGYQEASVIVDGELVPGIGGGVCQVGTTLFNAVAEAGLEILSRSNHSLYISHYPIGRDATVDYGRLDLKFRNDTPYGLFLRAVVDPKALTVSVYSSPLGRSVTWEQSPQSNPREPAVKFVDDPLLPLGIEQVTEEGKPGFDITTIRRVVAGDQVLREDKFVSKYRPWKRIVRRGIGPALVPSPGVPVPPGATPAPPAPPATPPVNAPA